MLNLLKPHQKIHASWLITAAIWWLTEPLTNALMGWFDEKLGISNEVVQRVLIVVWHYGIPAVLIAFGIWFLIQPRLDNTKKADSLDTNRYVKDMQFNAAGTLLQGSGRFAISTSEIGVFAEYSFHSPRGNPKWSENGFRFEICKLEKTVKNGYVHIDIAREGVNQSGNRNIYIGDPAKNYPFFPGQNRVNLYLIGPDGQEQTFTVDVVYSGSLEKDALTLLQVP
jgi:hypothetical protein